MARTSLTLKQLAAAVWNRLRLGTLYTKLAEHDTALDALESGTTSSVVTIHPVRSASTANAANLAAFTVANDGVTLVAGDRVLLKDQSTGSENGIYVVGTVGTGTAPLTRATDFDAGAEVKPNTMIAVAAGTVNASTLWQITNTTTPTVGSTTLTFSQIRNATQFDARLALTTTPGGASYVGVFDTAAYYTATNVETVLAEIGPKLIAKKTVTVTDDELTGASQVVNIGTALPANAVVIAHELNVTEQFANEADTTITIGGTDADAIVASTDLDALGIGKYSGTLGAHPQGSFGSEQLVATFAATALDDLNAGSVTITVWYMVLA